MSGAHRHSLLPCPVAQEEQDWPWLYWYAAPRSTGLLRGKEGGTGAEARGEQLLLPPPDLQALLVGAITTTCFQAPLSSSSQAGHPLLHWKLHRSQQVGLQLVTRCCYRNILTSHFLLAILEVMQESIPWSEGHQCRDRYIRKLQPEKETTGPSSDLYPLGRRWAGCYLLWEKNAQPQLTDSTS